jgi:hypothetical protein
VNQCSLAHSWTAGNDRQPISEHLGEGFALARRQLPLRSLLTPDHRTLEVNFWKNGTEPGEPDYPPRYVLLRSRQVQQKNRSSLPIDSKISSPLVSIPANACSTMSGST